MTLDARQTADEARVRRVLVVVPSSKLGGSQRVLAQLVRLLPAFGWEPVVVLLEGGLLEEALIEIGCDFEVMRAHRTRQLHRTVATIGQLVQRIRSADCEMVFSNEGKGHAFGGAAAFLSRRPSVYWEHGTPERSIIESVAVRVPAAAVIVGSESAAHTQRRLSRSTPVVKIAPGVDSASLARRVGSGVVIRTALGWDLDVPVVGIVGRLAYWKGQHVFLEAARLLAITHPRTKFLVVGGASENAQAYEEELHQRVTGDRYLRGRVHFSGGVGEDEVYQWMDALTVAVHCSFDEPFGLVLLEAMALGKPLVASASGGPLDVVEDEVSGLLVSPGESAVLAATVARILDDPNLASRLGAAALERVREFDERQSIARVAALFDQAIERNTKTRKSAFPKVPSTADG